MKRKEGRKEYVGEADEPHICDEFELETERPLLTRLATHLRAWLGSKYTVHEYSTLLNQGDALMCELVYHGLPSPGVGACGVGVADAWMTALADEHALEMRVQIQLLQHLLLLLLLQ